MKRKMLIVTAMLAVMVAMTGIAAADSSHIIGTVLKDGVAYTAGDATIEAYNDAGMAASALIGTTTANSGGGFSMDTVFVPHVWLKGSTPAGLMGTANGDPLEAVYGFNLFLVNLSLVPEFPTVALPIAAVIGLVFFFQQKKNKKE